MEKHTDTDFDSVLKELLKDPSKDKLGDFTQNEKLKAPGIVIEAGEPDVATKAILGFAFIQAFDKIREQAEKYRSMSAEEIEAEIESEMEAARKEHMEADRKARKETITQGKKSKK